MTVDPNITKEFMPMGGIKDSFEDYNTKALLVGKQTNDYYKNILFEIIKHYNDTTDVGNTPTKSQIIKYLHKVFTDKALNYDKLMKYFKAQSNECLLAYMLIAYKKDNLDLTLRAMYTFGRVLPMNTKQEWFDNYRLNNYGNPLNMVMWRKYDCNDVYTVSKSEPEPINESVEIFWEGACKFLVGTLREFIIDKNLYPHSGGYTNHDNDVETMWRTNKQFMHNVGKVANKDVGKSVSKSANIIASHPSRTHNVGKSVNSTACNDVGKIASHLSRTHNASSTVSNTTLNGGSQCTKQEVINAFRNDGDIDTPKSLLTQSVRALCARGGSLDSADYTGSSTHNNNYYKHICDECYKHYPFYFGGAHGCDVFDIPEMSITLQDIKKFLDRYPSAVVGYILNTQTYSSGQGEHWVALVFTKGKAKLICSQQSDFTAFHDGGKLMQTLRSLGFGLEYNSKLIQKDDFNCGLYSALSLFEMLCNDCDILKSVNAIGVNGTNIKPNADIHVIRSYMAGVLNSTDRADLAANDPSFDTTH